MYVQFPSLAAADGFITTLLGMFPAWVAGALASRISTRGAGVKPHGTTASLRFFEGRYSAWHCSSAATGPWPFSSVPGFPLLSSGSDWPPARSPVAWR